MPPPAWQARSALPKDGMQIRLVLAHPLQDSLNARLARHARARLEAMGHTVGLTDLYAEEFAPALTPQERARYYDTPFEDRAGLAQMQGLVLVFPTWWFGLPAVLKGWIDRSFLPGVAYDHAPDGGPMVPRLGGLARVMAITTLGAPWWYDRLVVRQPVHKALKWGVLRPVAPHARFAMASFHRAETATEDRIARFETRLTARLTRHFSQEGPDVQKP